MAIAIKIKACAIIEPGDGAQHRLDAFAHAGPRKPDCTATNRAGAGEMVIDLAAHHRRLADHRIGKIRRLGRGGVHDNRERRLERMSQIARMGARFFGLPFRMGQQSVQFFHQRLHFKRERFCHPVRPRVAHPLDRKAHPAQRAEPVPGLQHRHQEQAEPKHHEAADQDRANTGDLAVQIVPAGGHGEPPFGIAARQDDRPFHHPQRLIGELEAVVGVRKLVEVVRLNLERAVPQRAREKLVMPLAYNLPVEPAIGLEEALIAQRAVEEHFAVGANFRRSDHCG